MLIVAFKRRAHYVYDQILRNKWKHFRMEKQLSSLSFSQHYIDFSDLDFKLDQCLAQFLVFTRFCTSVIPFIRYSSQYRVSLILTKSSLQFIHSLMELFMRSSIIILKSNLIKWYDWKLRFSHWILAFFVLISFSEGTLNRSLRWVDWILNVLDLVRVNRSVVTSCLISSLFCFNDIVSLYVCNVQVDSKMF